MDRNSPTVGDLFCGAGGFSEGFRQAGFQILWAVDSWKPAITTYEKNLGVSVTNEDINDFDFDKLPRVDVLIGSPPCQPFSLANKGGGGDVANGLRLVARFLEAVKELGPKYWIMENVSNLKPALQSAWRIDRNHFTKRDAMRYFPRIEIINSSLYGVPQRRKRLFSGNFPMSLRNELPEIPMRKVIHGLPCPLRDASAQNEAEVSDPLYPIAVKPSELTDHFSIDTSLDEHSLRMSKQAKTQHRWAGKMKFPDNLGLPSRTICATSQKSGRQAIVIEDSRGDKGIVYRTPTIREIASLQGFAITYQFWASNVADKQTLVGNAVPPPVARALALAIREDMNLPYNGQPSFYLPAELPPPLHNGKQKHKYRFSELRRYQHFVPGMPAYCRVELDNQGQPCRNPQSVGKHLIGWRVVLYLGYSREYACFELDLNTAIEVAIAVLKSKPVLDPQSVINRIITKSIARFEGKVTDATTLQAIWTGRIALPNGPDWILSSAQKICEEMFPQSNLKSGIEAREFASLLKGRLVSGGKEHERGDWKNQAVDAYTACSAVSLAVATKFANQGVDWARTHWKELNTKQAPVDDESPSGVESMDASLLADYQSR